MLLPVGTEDFKQIIDKKLDFVDKTLFIKELFDDITSDRLVFTRPRRFGKTLNLSMLHYFLASEVNNQKTAGLFDNLKIAQYNEQYMQHQGQYPVIFLTFKNTNAASYEEAIESIAKLISKLYAQHQYLLHSTKLLQQQKNDIDQIIAKTDNITDLKSSLLDLTEYLYLHHGVKPWLLIDEYDTPVQSAYVNGYYSEMIDLMRGLMGAALKTNPFLEKAVITGILRVAKESLFSGLNNLEVYTLLSPQYSEHFGFTEDEVNIILNKAQLADKTKEIKAWYNGYQIDDTVLYNPWSIAKCVKNKGATSPYWVNTSDNQLIKELLKTSALSFKKDFELLIGGSHIEKLIDDSIVFHYLNHNATSVWTLLFMSGYLKSESYRETEQGIFAKVAIPNLEVRYLYRRIIEQWLSDGYGIEWYNEFIDTLLNGHIDKFEKHLEKIVLQITSYHDFAKEPEAFYHGLMLGFTASLHSGGQYEIQSNRESGLGRFDIMLVPHDSSKLGIILELKTAADKDTLTDVAKLALQQIQQKQYGEIMRTREIAEWMNIGIGFRGKAFALCFEKQANN